MGSHFEAGESYRIPRYRFRGRKGQYEDWKGDKPRRSKFLLDLGNIIKKNANKLFMINIEIDAWEEVNRDYLLEEVFHSPYALCGYTAIRQVLKWAEGKHIANSRLKIIFEDEQGNRRGLFSLGRFWPKQP